jgi:hypothetical protein
MWFLGQELLEIIIRMESWLFVRMKVCYSESIIKKQQFDFLLLDMIKIVYVKIDIKYKLSFRFCYYNVTFK